MRGPAEPAHLHRIQRPQLHRGERAPGVAPTDQCDPIEGGPIGTLPWYFENGLIADGDPAMAWGPVPDERELLVANGSRLYFANLTGHFSSKHSEQTFKGVEAIGGLEGRHRARGHAGPAGGHAGRQGRVGGSHPHRPRWGGVRRQGAGLGGQRSIERLLRERLRLLRQLRGRPELRLQCGSPTLARSLDGGETRSKTVVEHNTDSASGKC